MKKIAIVFTAMLLIISISCSFESKVKSGGNAIGTKQSSKVENISLNRSYKELKPRNNRNLRTSRIENNKVFYENKAVVLTYHNISTEPNTKITIKPERFESDLKMLKENGFNVISLREMINAEDGKGTLPPNAVVITFDDGIESFYTYAYPMLLKYKVPATNFVITSRNETYDKFKATDKPLSPIEISEMYKSGLIDIQSHTNDSHEQVYINSELKKGAKLTNRIYDKETKTLESEGDYQKRVLEDLNKSRELIYKYTGTYPDVLCFPFGIYTKHVIELAKQCGFNYFVTTQQGVNKQDSHNPKIYRIRSGDTELTTEKLLENIKKVAENKKQ